ncbi:MAG: FAD-dependent oxidoreductase [Sedimentisphaerales bacterium]|nr:FAD-dependent oxidoreductase [Sedimentisphaerales bacterium]
MALKVVIVGGVAAGPKVASRIVRLCPEAQVTLFEMGEFLSYAGCGLPYYISGVVKEQKELMSTPVGVVRDPVFFQNVKNVKICNHTEVTAIDRQNKKVSARNLKDNTTCEVAYDKLVLATGASSFVPPIEGTKLQHVYTLHGVEDAEGIKASFKERSAQNVTIVGGGLIGIEMAEAFAEMGARVTVVEAMDQILTFLDWEMALQVVKHLNAKGVKVLTGTKVSALVGNGSVEKVITDKGEIPSEIAIIAVGVRPSSSLAKAAGLEVGKGGGIVVNDKMQTSDPDIFAAGDCVEMTNMVTGKPCYVPLGSTANKQGRVAADNICGSGRDRFPGVLGTAICKVFDFAVGATGLSEVRAKAEGYDVITVLTPAPDKAHFYPTAKTVMLKLVVDKATRRLLGMQGVGPGDADKRIDVAATAITAKMTVDDIANLDLAYAPPFAPAMDNIITAANIARNKLDGIFESVTPMEVKAMLDAGQDIFLLDVRTPDEYNAARIPGGVLIPLGKVRTSLDKIPHDKPVIAFCKISLRGYEAALILKANGYTNVKVMDGGVVMWPYGLEN